MWALTFLLNYSVKTPQENYTAPRLVLSAYGVEHEELISAAEPLLSDLPGVARSPEPESVYTGGDYRCQADSRVCMSVPSSYLFRLTDYCIQ